MYLMSLPFYSRFPFAIGKIDLGAHISSMHNFFSYVVNGSVWLSLLLQMVMAAVAAVVVAAAVKATKRTAIGACPVHSFPLWEVSCRRIGWCILRAIGWGR
jgi:hypothetical protein